MGEGVGDDGDGAARAPAVPGGQADAVDGERALLDDLHAAVVGQHDGEALAVAFAAALDQAADAVDVAAYQVTAQALAEGQGALEIDGVADRPAGDGGLAPRLGTDVEAGDCAVQSGHGQAHAVHGDAIAKLRALGKRPKVQGQDGVLGRVAGLREAADVFDDAGEHPGM